MLKQNLGGGGGGGGGVGGANKVYYGRCAKAHMARVTLFKDSPFSH